MRWTKYSTALCGRLKQEALEFICSLSFLTDKERFVNSFSVK
jgi:hypothetical protein